MERKRVDWAKEKVFRRDGVVLTLWILPLRWPKYRFDIGCEGQDGKIHRGFMVDTNGGNIRHGFYLESVSDLVREAEEYLALKTQDPPSNGFRRTRSHKAVTNL
jgi:hypothetical protein